jgi:enoyl-CoA hydratase/carnithine racemase
VLGHISYHSAPSVIISENCNGTEPKYIKTEKRGRVGIITLNRPNALNALNDTLMAEVGNAVSTFNADNTCGCIILTGAGRAFAAGADIKEMENVSYYRMSSNDKIAPWEQISKSKLPIIAAVNGVALGGGCEIAMMCDVIYASDRAVFGQPEIKIGTIPGAGGTQRLTRAVGKSKAMELVLSGSTMSAVDAERSGLISKVIPHDELIDKTLKLANQIAALSRPVVVLAKESVNSAYEMTLNEGMHMERRLFHSTFALSDQKEGMSAFIQKRAPNFAHM